MSEEKKNLRQIIVKKWLLFFRSLKMIKKEPMKILRDEERQTQSVRVKTKTISGDVEKLLTIEDDFLNSKTKFIISDLNANPEFMLIIKNEKYKDVQGNQKTKKILTPKVFNWDFDNATRTTNKNVK